MEIILKGGKREYFFKVYNSYMLAWFLVWYGSCWVVSDHPGGLIVKSMRSLWIFHPSDSTCNPMRSLRIL